MIKNLDSLKELYKHLSDESDIIVFSRKTGTDNLMEIIKRDFEEYLVFLYLLSERQNGEDILKLLDMIGVETDEAGIEKYIANNNLNIDGYTDTIPEAIDQIIRIENEQNLMMHLVMKGKILGSTAHPSLEMIDLFRHIGDELGLTGNMILDKYILDVENHRTDNLEEP